MRRAKSCAGDGDRCENLAPLARTRHRTSALFSLLLAGGLAAGCGDERVDQAPRPTSSLKAGDYTVRVDPAKTDIALLHGDTVLLDFRADGVELGTLPMLDDTVSYDPYSLYVPSALKPPPDGLAWLAVESLTVSSSTATAMAVDLTYAEGKRASLSIEVTGPGSFRARIVPDKAGASVAYFRLRPRASDKEGFYGLGEHYDDINQRGKIRAMQLELDPTNESGDNEEHVPIPFLIGTKGWGLYVASSFPGVFAVANEEAHRIDAAFGTGLKSNDGLVFHLFGEPDPIDITRHYYDVTGYPRLPARWALGPWVWRDENKDQAQVEGDITAMRDLDLAATGYWIDRPYATAVNTFDFSAAMFTDPQAMIDKIHGYGFRTALWHTPYLDEKDPATAALRAEADKGGYYPPTVGVLLNKWGKPIDLTNPDAYAFWQEHIRLYTSMGVEGFKLDYGEDVVPGLTNARNAWVFSDGSDERTMHTLFQRFYHQVYAETLPSSGGFLLCRHATPGDQTNGLIIWPGDLDASFARAGDTVPDGSDSYIAVGGLAASMIAGLSLGPSGFPFYGADTGGYRHSPPDKELFTRWFEQTALSTVMEIGNSENTVAWEFDPKTGYDNEMLGWYRTYTRLHLRLFPYEWTYAQNLAKDGRAIQRPLGLAHPELGVHPNDIYLFGDSLLVAPVLDRGATERDVILPAGRFIDWWTGEVHEGNQTIHVKAPLDTLPLFLAEGGIIPMLRPTIDTTAPTTQSPDLVDSYATTPGVLYARVAPGAMTTFSVFDGASLSQQKSQGKVILTSSDGSEFKLGVWFEVVAAGKKPSGVTEGGMPLPEVASVAALEAAASGWTYVPDVGGSVMVKVPSGKHQVEISGL